MSELKRNESFIDKYYFRLEIETPELVFDTVRDFYSILTDHFCLLGFHANYRDGYNYQIGSPGNQITFLTFKNRYQHLQVYVKYHTTNINLFQQEINAINKLLIEELDLDIVFD